jgi:hypothetical protein
MNKKIIASALFLLAGSLYAEQKPQPPMATCFWYSAEMDKRIENPYGHIGPTLVRVNGQLKAYSVMGTVPMNKQCSKSKHLYWKDFRLVGDSHKDKVEVIS